MTGRNSCLSPTGHYSGLKEEQWTIESRMGPEIASERQSLLGIFWTYIQDVFGFARSKVREKLSVT